MTKDELRTWRVSQGYSQAALGKMLERSGRQVRNWELGATPIPLWVDRKLRRRGLKVVQ